MSDPSHNVAHRFLRQATHAAHVRLNQHPLLINITRPSFKSTDYRRILIAYHRSYQVIESLIREHLPCLSPAFDYGNRWKLDWLTQDIHHFGLATPQGSRDTPRITTDIDILGVIYVVEGSTLGGQVISTSLKKHMGLDTENGARFFSGYGLDTATFWHDLLTYLRHQLPHHDALTSAAQAAQSIFELIESHLDAEANRTPG